MVAKISVGKSLYGALAYNGEKINEAKGRLLATNKIFNDGTGMVDINRAMNDFRSCMPEHMRVEKPVLHISLNPHPDDVLTDTELQDIAREYLEKLRAQGERMAVFTSCVPAHCKTALAVHDLNRCFERVIFAQELGMDKSDPAIFAKAMELLGVTPQECIFFDDSVKSCRSAKASGMTVIGVYDPFFEGTKDEMPLVCDRFIRDFGEML